ncbi:MAG: acyl carrier protein [Bacilli bacterium]|nr:acyl carrier protein [Bacilli bacterium]
MLEKISDIICNFADVKPEDITLNTNIKNDLGLNSLELVNLVVELENTFGIKIPDEEIINIETVKDAIKVIEKHQK